MKIRKATINDLNRLDEIYAYARNQMKKNGNPNQWGDHKPDLTAIQKHIEEEITYVLEDDSNEEPSAIHGAFVFYIGADPTYTRIDDGCWINDDTYGVIHQVASDGSVKGMLGLIVDYCNTQITNLRIDTHHDNHIMQHLLGKYGFERCGIIYLEDGDPRIAYQRVR